MLELPDDIEVKNKLYLACSISKDYRYICSILDKIVRLNEDENEDESEDDLLLNQIITKPKILLDFDGINISQIIIGFIASIKYGDLETARKILKFANERVFSRADQADNNLSENMKAAIAEATAVGNIKAVKLRTTDIEEIPKVNDDLEVLTKCYKYYPKTFEKKEISFSEVLAVKKSKSPEWLELDKESARKLFPPRGKIVHFPAKNLPHLPRENEYGVWKVEAHKVKNEERQDDHASIHAVDHVMPVFNVADLENTLSTDIRDLRNKIKMHTCNSDYEFNNKIFHTKDNIFTMPEKGINQLVHNKFNQAINAWKQLDIIQLTSGLNLHIGELPDTEKRIDLSNSETVVYRSLEQLTTLSPTQFELFSKILKEIDIQPHLIEDMQIDELTWHTAN